MISRRRRAATLALLAALVATHAATAVPPSGDDAEGSQADARSKFGEAVKLFKQGEVERSLPLFEELARTTGSPNARLYVGHCLKQLERWSEAHAAFSAVIAETTRLGDDKYELTRQAARAELEALEARVAKLVITLAEAPEELSLRVDGVPLDPNTLGSDRVLEPGSHRVEATGRGVEPILRTIVIEAGETKTLSLAFDQAARGASSEGGSAETGAPSRGQLRTLGFAAAGVGVAGVAVWTLFGLQAKSAYDELESECPEGCTDSSHRDRIDSGKSSQTIANVGLAVGAVGLAAGGALLYLGFSDEESARPSLALSPGSASLSYRGRF
jgi:hypothetical protein